MMKNKKVPKYILPLLIEVFVIFCIILLPLQLKIRLLLLIILAIVSILIVFVKNPKAGKWFCYGCLGVSIFVIAFCLGNLIPKYYMNNREIIKTCYDEYPQVFSVIKNNSRSLELYVNEYYESEGLITDVTFTPEDCLHIAEEVAAPDNDLDLSFVFPNGAVITFTDRSNGVFKGVVLDNSGTRGYIIPNTAYYDEYVIFENYYIYGALNDLPTFEESQKRHGIHENFLKMLTYAVNNANVYTDRHTYKEEYFSTNYLYDDHSFGYLLDSLSESEDKSNIYIEENDMRVYTDRYTMPYLLRRANIRFDDLALSMESLFEKRYEEAPDSVFEYLVRDNDEFADEISHLKESHYYLTIGISAATGSVFLCLIIIARKKALKVLNTKDNANE